MSINTRYIVNDKTLYIESKIEGNNSLNSVVMEMDGSFRLYIPSKPLDIIRDSCRHYGKELKYQTGMSKAIVGNKYMLPICISEQCSIIFIPTGKYDAKNTYWIAFQHVLFSRDLGNGITCIHFKDGNEIRIPLNYNVWETRIGNGEKIFDAINKR